MNEHTTYNNGFQFPECFRNVGYVTVHEGSNDERPRIPVIWYRWGHSSDLKQLLKHNNGRTVLGWHFNLLEKAMSYLKLDEVDEEPHLDDGDYRKIFIVHDITGLDHKSLPGFLVAWKLWRHLREFKCIVDHFYPWCLHRKDFVLGKNSQARWFTSKNPLNRSRRFVNSLGDLLDILPAARSLNEYPKEYLPQQHEPGACTLETSYTPQTVDGPHGHPTTLLNVLPPNSFKFERGHWGQRGHRAPKKWKAKYKKKFVDWLKKIN
ncbi:hypothetical protein QBC38DRAFT_441421 [Podospora fimiseda]|uniref:Uncharacterized protein n=1 Tax=Podospora fimiseda TaxID=252190 RepID=A0AAN7GZ87_9PEZI|nr:hypothetical protein QBC38DRAFT_441421 [Podospora fimiseda]